MSVQRGKFSFVVVGFFPVLLNLSIESTVHVSFVFSTQISYCHAPDNSGFYFWVIVFVVIIVVVVIYV